MGDEKTTRGAKGGRPYPRVLRPGQVRTDPAEDIHAEIELYLELRAEELEAEGLTPEEARRVARERFGDVDRIEGELRREAAGEKTREGWTMTISALVQDLRYALRGMRRSPGFSFVAVATLALALGGSAAIFSVVDATLLSALPFADHERLVFLNGYHLVDGEISVRGASFPEFRDWQERSRAVPEMAAVSGRSLTLTGDAAAEQVPAEVVTEEYFDLLGVSAERGRTFQPEEHAEPDAHPVAVISDALRERRFGRGSDAVGATLFLNQRPLTVVGVMPAGFGGTNLDTDVWVPESMVSLFTDPSILESRGTRFLTVIGRLAPGADVEAAQRELDVIATDLQAAFPRAHEDRFSQVQSFRDGYLGGTGRLLWILLGAGLLLLVIAASNVANLLLVRSHGRTRELVLRRALGAEGRRIAGQLLAESAVLATLGTAAGVGIAMLALRVLGPMIPSGVLPGYVEPRFGASAFLFSVVALGLVGVATGLVPAVSSARMDIATRLRDGKGASAGAGPGRLRTQHVFVIAQVGLALVLLVGAGLLTRSFRAQLAVETGAELDGVVAMRTQLPNSRYDSDEAILDAVRELERRLEALPGAASASVSSDLPFRGGSSGIYMLRAGDTPEDRIRVHRHSVSAGYFETLGIDVVDGRGFTADDVEGAPRVVVITTAMAERVYPGERAVGKTMMLRPDGSWNVEVVGVLEDVRFRDVTTSLMADANSPDVFFPIWQMASRGLEIAVRAGDGTADATDLLPAMRTTLAEVDADLPGYELASLREGWRARTATPRFAAFLMSLFSLLATVLACVGVYGVLAFAVGQRAREIAIRRAIGATGGSVARSVVVDGVRLAVIGLAIGGVAAAAGSRVLEGFLFGVESTDPLTYLSVGAAMVAVAVTAAAVPALRAMRRDPAEALGGD